MTTSEMKTMAVVAGGLLAALGVSSRRRGGVGLMAAGAGLVWWGLRCSGSASERGQCAVPLSQYGAGVTAGIYDHVAQAAKEERHPVGTLIEDVVEEASDDSFPCSDPPAWTAR